MRERPAGGGIASCLMSGAPGEIFITTAKGRSTIFGLMDAFATVRFEPSGWTGNQQIPYAKSIMDYIFRWLGARFLGPE